MVGYIKEDYATALNTYKTDAQRNEVNNNGGLILYTLPKKYHNLYNEILIKVEHFYFATPSYIPQTGNTLPSLLTLSNDGMTLSSQSVLDADIYVSLMVEFDLTMHGPLVFKLSAGAQTWTLPYKGEEIIGVSLYEVYTENKMVETLNGRMYFVKGAQYIGDDVIIDESGQFLYLNTRYYGATGLVVRQRNAAISVGLSASAQRGVAWFNIQSIVSSWIATRLQQFKDETPLIVEPSLFVPYEVFISGGVSGLTIFDFVAFNAVAQIGEDTSRDDNGVINLLPLRIYEGYPAERTIRALGESVTYEGEKVPAETVCRKSVQTRGETITDKTVNLNADTFKYSIGYDQYKEPFRAYVRDWSGEEYCVDLSDGKTAVLSIANNNGVSTITLSIQTLTYNQGYALLLTASGYAGYRPNNIASIRITKASDFAVTACTNPTLKLTYKTLQGAFVEAARVAGCVPPSPFYLRWIGRNGAVESYMFEKRQTRKIAVKSVSKAEANITDNSNANRSEQVYDIGTENQIIIGVDNIAHDEFDVVKYMPLSPLIEYYNTDLGKWIRLAVNKYELSEKEDERLGSMEVTMDLPKINTQY